VLNQQFRGIVCFQSLNPVFVSRSHRIHSFDPKSPRPAGTGRLFEKLRAAVGGGGLARLVTRRGVTVGHQVSALTRGHYSPGFLEMSIVFSNFYF
jgi:hypothetical protein